MDSARIKTFLILLLLTVNVVFLSLLAVDRFQAVQFERQERAELVLALARMGVVIEQGVIPANGVQATYFLSRDVADERLFLETFLGVPLSERHQGGGLYQWEGLYGFGETRLGSFSMTLTDSAYELSDTGLLLGRMGFSGERTDSSLREVTYRLSLDGLFVIGGYVTFRFAEARLEAISGTALWGGRQRIETGVQLSVTTALVTLAGYVQGQAITRFTTVTMGYYLLEAPGLLELRPAWVIQTDDGAFVVDRLSGEIRHEPKGG